MGLKFEVDSLEGIDASLHWQYKQVDGGKYRLDVEGIDPADELKRALGREREERKTAKQEAEELRKQLEAKELGELEAQKKYEELYKRAQDEGGKTKAELDLLRKNIADKERSESALKVAGALTRDASKAALLQEQAQKYVEVTPEGVKFRSPEGTDWTAEQLQAHLGKTFPFLADGNQASGGGAAGGSNAAPRAGNMGGSKAERRAAIAAKFPELQKG